VAGLLRNDGVLVIVAIDGPSGVGKSTVSKAVALRLGLEHLDTGATYRAATLAVVRSGVDIASEEAVLTELAMHTIGYSAAGITLDGEIVAQEVRSNEVTSQVSALSAHAKVRAQLVAMQREWVASRGGDVVVEGRDIGTVVFPDVAVKVYLTASAIVRATRRSGDSEVSGKSVEAIASEIETRDLVDSTRAASPLRPAEDARVIDTSDLTIQEVVDRIVDAAADT